MSILTRYHKLCLVLVVSLVAVIPAVGDLRHPRPTEAQKKEMEKKFGVKWEDTEAMWKQCELLGLVVKSFFAAIDAGDHNEAFDHMQAAERFNNRSDNGYSEAVAQLSQAVTKHPALNKGLTRDFFNVSLDTCRKGAGTVHAKMTSPSGSYEVDFDIVDVKHGWKIAKIIFDQFPAFENPAENKKTSSGK